MELFRKLKMFESKKNNLKLGIKKFVKDSLVFVGLASAGTFSCNTAAAYGPPDPICEYGERECVENYAMICYDYFYSYYPWFSLECEIGCSEGACIDNKVKNAVVTDCELGEIKTENGETKLCIDGVWFDFNIDEL